MSNIAVFDYTAQGWDIVSSLEEFNERYPERDEYTRRLPKPASTPEKYPCLIKELATEENRYGPDFIHIAYIYDFKQS